MSLLLDRKRIRDGLRLSVLSVEDAIAESVVQLAIPRPPQSLPHHQKHHGGTAATAMGSGQRRIINNVPSGALSPTSASLDDLAADDWYLMRHDHSPPPALLAAIPHHFAALAHIDAVGFGSASPLVVMGSGGVTSSSGQLVFSSSPSVAVSAAAPSVGGAGTLNGPGAPIVGTEAPELTLPAVSRGASPIEPANGAEPPLQLPLPPPARRTSLPNASIIGSSPGIPVPVLPPAPPTSRRRSSLDDSAFDPPSHHSNPNVSGAERGGSSTLAPVPESSAGTPASAAAQLGDGEPLSLPQSETSAGSAAAGGAAEAFPQLPTASGHHQYRAQIIDLPMVIGSRNGSADDVASAAATAQTARSMVASTSFGEELVDYEAELAFAEDEAEDAAAAAEVSGAAAAAAARQLQQQRISRARDSTAVRRLSAGEMGKELGVIVTEPMRQGFAPPPRRPSLPFLAPILLPAISAGITTDDDYTGGGRRGLVLPPPPPVPPPVPPMTAPPTPVTPDHSTRPSSIPASLPPPTPQSEKSEAAPSLFAKRPVVALVPGKKAMPSQLAMLLGVTGTAGQNPLALNYSRYAGKHAHHSVPLKLFLPFTGEPPASISLAVARGTTVEQAIGYALFEYVERGMQPSLDAARLEPTRWAMRIAEDDGEVDDDFPALDRTRPVDRFAFDAFALCEIGGGDGNGPPIVTPSTAHSGMTFTNGTSKRANPSNGTGTRPGSAAARMDGSTTSTAAAVVGGATAGGGALASTAPAALTGQSTQFPPTVPGVGALGPAAAAAGAAASTLAAVNLPPMPIAGVPEKLFLRVHLYATVECAESAELTRATTCCEWRPTGRRLTWHGRLAHWGPGSGNCFS
ncbi:stress-activated map kinase interacting protein 1-domain-containing protein [Blastocladiella britannica]|nr:stress-activated map kinase interacting protein 1-domain-containing protein [Blastocladiella britannica]